MYNLTAELNENLNAYRAFINERTSVNYPPKLDVPMVWDLYMDTTAPVGNNLSADALYPSQNIPSSPELNQSFTSNGPLEPISSLYPAVSVYQTGPLEPVPDMHTVTNPLEPISNPSDTVYTQPRGSLEPISYLPAAMRQSSPIDPVSFLSATACTQITGPSDPISYLPAEFGGEFAPTVTYQSPINGNLDLLGLVNDRLKTQARRYPHPISNEMEDFN